MRLLIVDDEHLILGEMEELLMKMIPGCCTRACLTEKKALQYASEEAFDIAFLDIELGHSNGIMLAKRLKEMQPDVKIIFVTSYPQYAVDAFAIHATGYLLKPVRKEDIKRELTFIYGDATFEKKLRVKTFGGFEVHAKGGQLVFKRTKAKELLAYLIERRGYSVNIRQVCAVLFGDTPYDRNQKSYFHMIMADLRNTLQEADAEDILVHSRNSFAIDVEKIDCDYYRFLAGDAEAVNMYQGEFLPQYSWAEFSAAELYNKKNNPAQR